jgi:hypothetical protein
VLLEHRGPRTPDAAEVRAGVEEVDRLIGNDFYKVLAVRLPNLIVSAHSATVQDAPDA